MHLHKARIIADAPTAVLAPARLHRATDIVGKEPSMKSGGRHWRSSIVIRLAVLLAVSLGASAQAVITVTPHEMAAKDKWVQQHLLTTNHVPPFSFIYGRRPSSLLLPSWTRMDSDATVDANRTKHVLRWETNGLRVKCVAVDYNDFPVVEWTVYLKNIGTTNTRILENIQGLDTVISHTNGPPFVLHGNKGDFCAADSYEPFTFTLGPKVTKTFGPPQSGKSTDGPKGWPYYNLQVRGGGVILAIGWPGQWASSFACDDQDNLRVRAGQQLTHFFLKPGETVRTPLIAMMFWRGTNVIRSQNLWRHFYLAHVIPRINGQPPSAISQIQVGGALSDTNSVDAFLRAGIKPDLCWRDAGGASPWYPISARAPYKGGNAWINTGTWVVDPKKFPQGFKPFSDWVHAHGMKFILWFEPERVGDPGSWLERKHPEWLLLGTRSTVGDILNEGNPVVFHWLTNHFEGMIQSNGLDWYREDMNGGGPFPAWRNHDTMDRQGITENFYVQRHLAYWDALLAMNPGLRIDACASGGRRNDLETMRRAVPLLRSDFQWPSMTNVVVGNQCQTYGLSSWLPFQGTGCYLYDPYSFRSFYMPSFGMGGLTPQNTAAQRQAYRECKIVGPIMLFGDYYPLTPYSLAHTVWIAWQFDRPDTGEGCVQVFRRERSPVASMNFKLKGLVASKAYDVRDFDKGDLGTYRGRELMEKGLTLRLKPRHSAILYYTEHQGRR